MSLECNCSIPTRKILRQKISANDLGFLAAKCIRVPDGIDEDIRVVSFGDIQVCYSTLTDDRTIV